MYAEERLKPELRQETLEGKCKAVSASVDGQERRCISIRLACEIYGLSETCYCYQAKRNAENIVIADWLMKLTQSHKRWEFGLRFMCLRSVKGYGWNHKRVYRLYREL